MNVPRQAAASVGGAILGLAAASTAAQPRMAPPPAVVALAKALPDRFDAGDVAGYTALFAGDVAVYDHDHLIFKGRSAWSAFVAAKVAGDLNYKVVASAVGYDEILAFEAWSSCPRHPPPAGVVRIVEWCKWSRLAAYKVEDGKITEARFLDNSTAEPPP